MKRSKRNLMAGLLLFGVMAIIGVFSCQKVAYTQMESPAYLRVFNSLNQARVMDSKGDTVPYLCMLINAEFNAEGIPVDAEIVGDFLDQRAPYAPPYPSHIGVGTSLDNPEYPGREAVLVGPVLNGFDLSSWAQVPSGTLRFTFMYRPRSEVPFFDLDTRYKRGVVVDTTLQLQAGEVYTLQTLLKDFNTGETGVLLRQESFHKQALSDSSVYVNFYNYSADGFLQADPRLKLPTSKHMEHLFELGIRDTMNIYLSLYDGQGFYPYEDGIVLNDYQPAHPDYTGKYLTTLYRDNNSSRSNPYVRFPLWVSRTQDGISTDLWERLYFIAPGMQLEPNRFDEYAGFYLSHIGGVMGETGGNFAAINFLLNGQKIYSPDADCGNCAIYNYHAGVNFPNLVISTHSGSYNPRSFATVNTVEVINGQVYLTTVQRQYAPPANF